MNEPITKPRFPRSSKEPNHGRTSEQIAESIGKITRVLARRAELELPWGAKQRQFGGVAVYLHNTDSKSPELEVELEVWREEDCNSLRATEVRWSSGIHEDDRGQKYRVLKVMHFPSGDDIQRELILSTGELPSTLTTTNRATYEREYVPVVTRDIADHAAHILNMMRLGVNDAIEVSQEGQKEYIQRIIRGVVD